MKTSAFWPAKVDPWTSRFSSASFLRLEGSRLLEPLKDHRRSTTTVLAWIRGLPAPHPDPGGEQRSEGVLHREPDHPLVVLMGE
jgi:hypothetical protein